MNNSPFILACSGPGAMFAIQQSITIGYFCAVFGGVATIAIAYNFLQTRRVRFTLPVAGLLMLVHPAWTVSAIHGDCGYFKREVSYVLTAIFAGLLIRVVGK
ncbi:hypothetical protein V2H45_15395 [Tumidithrix elongata RA019]|uniref:Uncharacterized protein n=1 Tax=Tumidithrix elongata BACA0141 TaxID=2716417 RepID=A0AAW9Q2N5_9CYAN|nr:hypothetical protein [Tumidithrix elongata RA019]